MAYSFDRLREVFLAARGVPREERGLFLDGACAGEDELRAEVLEMLAADEDPHPVLRSRDVEVSELPERIGEYQIESVLGRGGMGIVYRAVQPRPRRTVALKILQPGYAGGQLAQRFVREREVLGALRHPGIAAIHDGGTFDSGVGELPYFVMELVEGVPIDRYVREEGCDERSICHLVIEICSALEHAHQRGVIHRDLKPGNVLVESGPGGVRPRILDFGIARVRDAADSNVVTRTGELFGTLPYMAPELLGVGGSKPSGDAALDPRIDVYSIGILLHELLTGSVPHDLDGLPLVAVVEALDVSGETAFRHLRDRVPRDLELIVSTAASRDARLRYPSARALADDLENFLQDRPLRAKRPSVADRTSKFVRRHRALVLGVSATLAALVVGLVAVSLLASRNRRLAEREAEGRLALRETLYAAELSALGPLVEDGTTTKQIRDVIDDWGGPGEGEPELRGWEFRFLRGLVDMSTTNDRIGASVRRLVPASDGSLLALTGGQLLPLDGATLEVRSTDESLGAAPNGALYPSGADSAPWVVWRPSASTWCWARADALGDERSVERPDWTDPVAIDPTGRWLAARTKHGSALVITDATDGRAVFEGEDALVDGFAFSPSGTRIAIGLNDRPVVEVRRVPDGARVASLDLHPVLARRFAWRPDGRELAIGQITGAARLWRPDESAEGTAPLEAARVLRDHADAVASSLIWSADGRRLALLDGYGALFVYEPDAESRRVLRGHESSLPCISFSSDGQAIVAGQDDGRVRRWDLAARPEFLAVRQSDTMGGPSVEWSADGGTVRLGRTHGAGRIHDARTGAPRGPASTAVLDPTETWEYERVNDRIVVRRREGRELRLDLDVGDRFSVAKFSPDGERLAVWWASVLRVYDLGSDDPPLTFGTTHRGFAFAWSDDGRWIAHSTHDPALGSVRILDARTGEERALLRAHGRDVSAIDWSPSGEELAVGTDIGEVVIVSLEEGVATTLLHHGSKRVHFLDWHPSDARLAVGDGGALALWDLEHDLRVFLIRGLDAAVEWSPDGRSLAVVPLGQPDAWIWTVP